MNVLSLILLYILFVVLYYLARKAYLFVAQLLLEKVFGGKVSFRNGYGFGSVQDIEITNGNETITCQLFKPTWGIRTRVVLKNVKTRNVSLDRVREYRKHVSEMWKEIHLPVHYFKCTVVIDELIFENSQTTLSLKNVDVLLTDSVCELSVKEIEAQTHLCDVKMENLHLDVHFSSVTPTLMNFVKPECRISFNEKSLAVDLGVFVGFSDEASRWRISTEPVTVNLIFHQIGFNLGKSDVVVNWTESFCCEFGNNWKIISQGIECQDADRAFTFKLKEIEMSKEELNIGHVIMKIRKEYIAIIMKVFTWTNVVKIDRAEMAIQIDESAQLDLLFKDINANQSSIGLEEFKMEMIVDNMSLTGITGSKTDCTKSTYEVHSDSIALSFCGTEKAKKTWARVFYYLMKELKILNRRCKLITSLALIENTIENQLHVMRRLSLSAEFHQYVPMTEAQVTINSLFPGMMASSAMYVVPLHFIFEANEIQSPTVQMTNTRALGMIDFLTSQTYLNTCGNINIRGDNASVSYIPNGKDWIFSYQFNHLKLSLGNSVYTMENVKGHRDEYSFESMHLERKRMAYENSGNALVADQKPANQYDLLSAPTSSLASNTNKEEKARARLKRAVTARKIKRQSIPIILGFSPTSDNFRKNNDNEQLSSELFGNDVLACPSINDFKEMVATMAQEKANKRKKQKPVFEIYHLEGTKGEYRKSGESNHRILKMRSMKMNNEDYTKAVITYDGEIPIILEAEQMTGDAMTILAVKYCIRDQQLTAKQITMGTSDHLHAVSDRFVNASIDSLSCKDFSLEGVEIRDSATATIKRVRTQLQGFSATIDNIQLVLDKNISIKAQSITGQLRNTFDFWQLHKYTNGVLSTELSFAEFKFNISLPDGIEVSVLSGNDLFMSFANPDKGKTATEIKTKYAVLYDINGTRTIRSLFFDKDSSFSISAFTSGEITNSVNIQLPNMTLITDGANFIRLRDTFSPLFALTDNKLFDRRVYKEVVVNEFQVIDYMKAVSISSMRLSDQICTLNALFGGILAKLMDQLKTAHEMELGEDDDGGESKNPLKAITRFIPALKPAKK